MHVLRRGWRGLWPPAQTLATDRFRLRRAAASNPPRGRTQVVAVIGATPVSGATTLTAVLAGIAHGLQGVSPALLAAGASDPLRERAPAHLPAPHERQPDTALIDAVSMVKAKAHTASVFVDAALETARTDPRFFTEADVVVVTRTPEPASAMTARSLIAWLRGIQANQIIEVTTHITGPGPKHPRHDLVIPHDPALRAGAVDLERLNLATLDAAVDLMALINTSHR